MAVVVVLAVAKAIAMAVAMVMAVVVVDAVAAVVGSIASGGGCGGAIDEGGGEVRGVSGGSSSGGGEGMGSDGGVGVGGGIGVGGGGCGGGGGRGWCPLWSPCPPKMSTIKLIILSKKGIVLKNTIIIDHIMQPSPHNSHHRTSTRGSGGKNVIFSNDLNFFQSVLIYSNRCQYAILKVSLGKNEHNLPVGCIKH